MVDTISMCWNFREKNLNNRITDKVWRELWMKATGIVSEFGTHVVWIICLLWSAATYISSMFFAIIILLITQLWA